MIQFSMRSCSERLAQHMVEKRLRDQHRAIAVDNNDVIGHHGDTAATDRLLPADEGQARHRRRRRTACRPDRQPSSLHADQVAHDAVGHQRRDPSLDHARAQDVAGGVARAAQPSLFVQTQAAISELKLFTALVISAATATGLEI